MTNYDSNQKQMGMLMPGWLVNIQSLALFSLLLIILSIYVFGHIQIFQHGMKKNVGIPIGHHHHHHRDGLGDYNTFQSRPRLYAIGLVHVVVAQRDVTALAYE